MTLTQHFRKSGPKIIGEVIDGEAVIINLASGCYYSLEGVGAVVWELIERESTAAQIVETINHRYRCKGADVARAVTVLLQDLQKDDLIEPFDGDQRLNSQDPEPGEASIPVGERPDFTIPELKTYTDMQEFLLVDPIHEVDDTGWPHKKDAPPECG